MTASRIFMMVALATSLCAVSACGRKAGLDTPYEAALDARKAAEKAKEPLPPEPSAPDKNKRFFLDALID